jgi:hypothetical protein
VPIPNQTSRHMCRIRMTIEDDADFEQSRRLGSTLGVDFTRGS